jgi:hypothetical protein
MACLPNFNSVAPAGRQEAFKAQPLCRSTQPVCVERSLKVRCSSHSEPLCWCRHHGFLNCSRIEQKVHPVRYTPRDSGRFLPELQ